MGGSMSLGIAPAVRFSKKAQLLEDSFMILDAQDLEQDSPDLNASEKLQELRGLTNERLRHVFDRRIDTWLETEPMDEIVEFFSEFLEWDLIEEPTTEEELRGFIKNTLMKDLEEVVFGFNREVLDISLNGTVWLVSGGMSYGDGPTDAYFSLNRLDVSGVLEKPLKARELQSARNHQKSIEQENE